MNDQIGLDTILAASGDIHGIDFTIISIFSLIIFIVGILSSKIFRRHTDQVRNLFLKIKISAKEKAQVGILRSLDLESAQLVTNFKLEKGSAIELDLSSLPNFPTKNISTIAFVKKVRKLSTAPITQLVTVRFADNSLKSISDPLKAFIKRLH